MKINYVVFIVVLLSFSIMISQSWAADTSIKSETAKTVSKPSTGQSTSDAKLAPKGETATSFKKESFKVTKSSPEPTAVMTISGKTSQTNPFVLKLFNSKTSVSVYLQITPLPDGTFITHYKPPAANSGLPSGEFGCGSSITMPDGSTVILMCATVMGLELNDNSYCPGETIRVTVNLPATTSPTAAADSFTLIVKNPNHENFLNLPVSTAEPVFTNEFTIPESEPRGEYTTIAQFLGSPPRQKTFELLPSEQCQSSMNRGNILDVVKMNARFWVEGGIPDSAFVEQIQFLIRAGYLNVPQAQPTSASAQVIPSWIKRNAGWWIEDQINDDDFMLAIEYLINNGIIRV